MLKILQCSIIESNIDTVRPEGSFIAVLHLVYQVSDTSDSQQAKYTFLRNLEYDEHSKCI